MTDIKDSEIFLRAQNRKLNHSDIVQFTLERFSEIKHTKRIHDLVNFHTMNKYLLMAHNVNGLAKLGNIVANHENNELGLLMNQYEKTLETTINTPSTKKSHANVLFHILGHFSKELLKQEKKILLNGIDAYESNKQELEDILEQFKLLTKRFDKYYLSRQTYFLLYGNSISNA